MGMPHITSFCWCMGLELGAKCVGFLHLLVSIALMTLCSIYAAEAGSYVGTVEDMDHLYSTMYKLSVTAAIISVVHVLMAITLLYSVIQRKAKGVRVWVLLMCLMFAGALACVLVTCATHGIAGSGSDIFVSFLLGLLAFGALAYCILCVYSYYLMLRSSEDMLGPNKTDY